jgi:DNA-binding winged helix-turn-helix (wHTH) protein
MPVPARNSRVLHFGVFEANLQESELRKDGMRIKLQDQPFQILSILLERPGETVSREELRQRLWPADTFVDFDHSLNSSIKKLREALGDNSDNPRFIETLHRRGYRFIAPVDGPVATALEARRQSPSRVALWVAAVAIVMLSGVTAWFLRFPSHQSQVARFTQITNDGRAKSGDRY